MLSLPRSLDDPRTIRLLDLLAIGWAVLWILVGFLVFHEVRGLRSLSDTVVSTGRALDATSQTLGAASSLPLVGGQIGDLAVRAHVTAQSAIASGRSSRSDVESLAVLLWIAIAAAPTLPLLVLYGLLRRRRER